MPLSSSQITQCLKAAKDRKIELSQDDVELLERSRVDSDLAKWLNHFDTSKLLTDEELLM
jgi:hypothetical protein